MEFVKAHGAGNDFVLLPDLDERLELTASLTRALCDRHTGLGADGVIRLGAGGEDADVFMDYRNADGSIAETCGNGVRCVAKYLVDRGLAEGRIRVRTRAGVSIVEVVEVDANGKVQRVRVDMGTPVETGRVRLDVSDLSGPAEHASSGGAGVATRTAVDVLTLSMGNPHAVVVVDDVATAPVAAWGPYLERQFAGGSNVEFIAAQSRRRVVGRIWERGVGETLASGTGASAMAAAAHLLGLTDRQVTVELPGGELDVDWGSETLSVVGPAVEVCAGHLDGDWLAALARL